MSEQRNRTGTGQLNHDATPKQPTVSLDQDAVLHPSWRPRRQKATARSWCSVVSQVSRSKISIAALRERLGKPKRRQEVGSRSSCESTAYCHARSLG